MYSCCQYRSDRMRIGVVLWWGTSTCGHVFLGCRPPPEVRPGPTGTFLLEWGISNTPIRSTTTSYCASSRLPRAKYNLQKLKTDGRRPWVAQNPDGVGNLGDRPPTPFETPSDCPPVVRAGGGFFGGTPTQGGGGVTSLRSLKSAGAGAYKQIDHPNPKKSSPWSRQCTNTSLMKCSPKSNRRQSSSQRRPTGCCVLDDGGSEQRGCWKS